ncbi:hypothetical protein H8E77_30270 [bacterium]|nr:hypothetical protein [bacterium]
MLELFRFPEPPRTTIGVLLPGYKQVQPALIDTGADRCVLPYEEGKQLNLPPLVNNEEIVMLRAVPCVRRNVQIAIPLFNDECRLDIPFMWAQEPSHNGDQMWDIILLGRDGFLDKIHLLDLYPIGFILFDSEGLSELVFVLQSYTQRTQF